MQAQCCFCVRSLGHLCKQTKKNLHTQAAAGGDLARVAEMLSQDKGLVNMTSDGKKKIMKLKKILKKYSKSLV